MSLYTTWTYGHSPLKSNAPLEPSCNSDARWPDTHNVDFIRYNMNLTASHHQNRVTDEQAPILDSRLGSKRLPQPIVLRPIALPPSDPSYYCHASLQKHRATGVANLASRESVSPTDMSHYPMYGSASASYGILARPQSHWYPQRHEDLLERNDQLDILFRSPSISPQNTFHSGSSYTNGYGDPPRRSKAALAAEDWDHPSFARPPHRPVEPKPKPTTITRAVDMSSVQAPCSASIQQEILKPIPGDAILVPNSYPVPPPPPYEQSAALLSDLAAEMVWERCFIPHSQQQRAGSNSPIMGSHSIPVNDSVFSPMVPPSDDRSRGYEAAYPSVRLGSRWDSVQSDRRFSSPSMFGVIGAEAKARRAQQAAQHAIKPLKTEAKPAFRRWTRQVLEQTLLSPQVLVLALYYVDVLSGQDVFGDAHRGKASLVPYKILLAGLVLANKTLDDHSYKNSTFANVSSMTNAEVNTIEVAMLKALKFDTVPVEEEWTRWVGEVVTAGERVGMNAGRVRKKEEEEIINQLKQQQFSMMSTRSSIFDQRPQDWSSSMSTTHHHHTQQQQQQQQQQPGAESSEDTRLFSTAEVYRDQLRSEGLGFDYCSSSSNQHLCHPLHAQPYSSGRYSITNSQAYPLVR